MRLAPATFYVSFYLKVVPRRGSWPPAPVAPPRSQSLARSLFLSLSYSSCLFLTLAVFVSRPARPESKASARARARTERYRKIGRLGFPSKRELPSLTAGTHGFQLRLLSLLFSRFCLVCIPVFFLLKILNFFCVSREGAFIVSFTITFYTKAKQTYEYTVF